MQLGCCGFPQSRGGGALHELGWLRGTCPEGQQTVPNAEAYALQQLLQHTSSEALECIVDSTICIKRFKKLDRIRQSRLQRMSNAETWINIRSASAGRSVKLIWCKSHLTVDQFKTRFPDEDVVVHLANARADEVAGEFIANIGRLPLVDTARAINHWQDERTFHVQQKLLERAAFFLLLRAERQGPLRQFGPARPTKRQLLAALPELSQAHSWSFTLSGTVARCDLCGLVLKEVYHRGKLGLLRRQPCYSSPVELPVACGVHFTHTLTREGGSWICVLCGVRSTYNCLMTQGARPALRRICKGR